MKTHFLSVWSGLFVILLIPMLGLTLEREVSPHTPVTEAVCVSCHEDGQRRWESNQFQPCTPYCMSCHQKSEMDRHHTVGTVLPAPPGNGLHLTAEQKVNCATCHDLSRVRYDSERWKAASLFDRLFHNESRYKTYFLVMRNDQGQLCLTCH